MMNLLKLERIAKGYANHNRIKILILLGQEKELSVGAIARKVSIDENNASQHLAKMAIAGLIMKRHDGAEVRHKLTDRGQATLRFLDSLS